VLTFIKAGETHPELLRDILISSKGYWGYPKEQLEQWRSNLQFEAEYIARNTVKLVLKEAEVIGFFALVPGGTDKPNELDHLWLLPNFIGKGYGNLVFTQILSECISLKITEFYIVSDPDALGFYLRKGAIKVGEVYSDAQKRMLPKLKYEVVDLA
jgi:hypothetical protein